jgi:hypothetical protein
MIETLGSADLALAAGGAVLAGVVRGFSGFGGAMVLVPILAATYGPQTAVPVMVLTDFVLTLPLAWAARRRCAWREIMPLTGGYALALPGGIAVLLVADPTLLTRATGLMVLALAALMALGLRRRAATTRRAAAGVGLAAGFLSGSTGIGGPPVVLFWLGGRDAAPQQVRANLIVLFTLVGALSLTLLTASGLNTRTTLTLTAVLMPLYGLGLLTGARGFTGLSERVYRPTALILVAAAGLTALLRA